MNMKTVSSYIAYGMLAVAACVWIAVGFFALFIQNAQAAYLEQIADAGTQAQRVADSVRAHAIAVTNQDRAAKLDAFVAPDVSNIIDAIKAVGTVSGTPVQISDALPASVPKNQTDIHAVAFVIESSGSFSSLIHTISLFETLPVPSSIEIIDLSRTPSDGSTRASQVWHLNLKLRAITTAAVSS